MPPASSCAGMRTAKAGRGTDGAPTAPRACLAAQTSASSTMLGTSRSNDAASSRRSHATSTMAMSSEDSWCCCREQRPKLCRLDVDVVARQDAKPCLLAHAHEDICWLAQGNRHRVDQRLEIAGRDEPAVPPVAYELRYARDVRADDGTAECHRLHDHDRKALRETRQDQRAGGKDLGAHLVAVDPAGDPHSVPQRKRIDFA